MLRVAVVRSFAVPALAYTSRVILVAAVRAGKQCWVGVGCFAVAMRAFGRILLWERCGDAEGLVAAGWTAFLRGFDFVVEFRDALLHLCQPVLVVF